MKAYRLSVNLKLGLVLFAVVIAVASLVYTNRLVDRLREREQFIIQLWASALEQLGQFSSDNPYIAEFREIERLLPSLGQAADASGPPSPSELSRLQQALRWAESMPPAGDIKLASDILRGATHDTLPEINYGIPAIVMDPARNKPEMWRNVAVPDSMPGFSGADSARAFQTLRDLAAGMAERYAPIPITQDLGDTTLSRLVYYDESLLVKELRLFPYIQLLFVGLFILAGYLGFSYVRRSEQRSLWVGMAKEAAHQLGTPISSLMGWHEILGLQDLPPEQETTALDEIAKDIDRLRRVANRFSDIGSLPKLEVMALAPVIESTADYMRRRIPQQGKRVGLTVSAPPDLRVPLNAELFEWVIENLVKNALDAIETAEGTINIRAQRANNRISIEVQDSGKGIDRRNWKNIFRPGYSTKKRGWGLGLSLAKRIVEEYHGGSLTLAHSRPGHGSTFRIELPDASR